MSELKQLRMPPESDGPPVDPTERERIILHGLACEWEGARRLLDPDYGRRLRRPLFALTDGRSRWGSWSADRREICLSRHLVFNHAWDAVREVLFHEMAHQLADEVCADIVTGAGNASPLEVIFENGTLARRILRALGGHADRDRLMKVYSRLCDCLAEGRVFVP